MTNDEDTTSFYIHDMYDQRKNINQNMKELVRLIRRANITIEPEKEDRKYIYNYPVALIPHLDENNEFIVDTVEHLKRNKIEHIKCSFQVDIYGKETMYYNIYFH